MPKIKIDDIEYDTDDLSEQSLSTLASVRFVDQLIQKKNHELNIARTARAAYAAALKRELSKESATATQGDQ